MHDEKSTDFTGLGTEAVLTREGILERVVGLALASIFHEIMIISQ